MTDFSVPWSPRGIDNEMVKVGRPCIEPRALAVADLVHHQVQRRRMMGHCVAYQPGDAELTTPTLIGSATVPSHTFRHYAGPNARFVRVTIWTLGAVTGTGTPFLTVKTTTDATGVTTARVSDADAPGTSINVAELGVYTATVEITPNQVEDVTIVQNHTTSLVRILSAIVTEMPIGEIDTTADSIYINLDNYEAGTPIIDTENDDLVLAQNLLRRQHKKLLFSDAREAQVTDVGAANQRDILTWVSGNPPASRGQWNLYPSVNLPETSGVSVTVVSLIRATAGTGTVQFSFSGGSQTVTRTAAAGLGVATATTTCAKSSDTLSIEVYGSDAGTVYYYGGWVYENWEAA